jgi:succinoglycan biosynthesis transport protein ExoP
MISDKPGGLENMKDMAMSFLFYLKYLRTMVLCLLLSFSAGLVYYTYTKAVYHSRLLVSYTPTHKALVPHDNARALAQTLESRYTVERAANRMGLTHGLGSFETIREVFVKKVTVSIVDEYTLAIDCYPFSRELLARFPHQMLQVYFEDRARQVEEIRKKQIASYEKQLDLLMAKMEDRMSKAFDFEEENKITELFIRQQGLTQLPMQMITTRQRLEAMDRVREQLNVPGRDIIAKLSLLSQFKMQEFSVGSTVPVSNFVPGATENVRKDPNSMDNQVALPTALPQNPGNVVVLPSMVVEDETTWQPLEIEWRKVQEEIREAERIYLPGHQVMRTLLERKRKVEESLNAEYEAALSRFELTYSSLQEKLRDLESKLPNYREVTQSFQRFRQDYNLRIGSDLEWGEAYKKILEAITRFRFEKEADQFLGEEVTPLKSLGFTVFRRDPVSPPKGKLVFICLFAGIGLAAAIPFLIEKVSDRVNTLISLESELRLPGLGVIPVYPKERLENIQRESIGVNDKTDWLMENFRNLRGTISMNRDLTIPSQAIMVSSAKPREGKTTVALNLAWAFASMGDKTLLIDCDLRRGRVHSTLDIPNQTGMTDVLCKQVPWRDAVQTTSNPNLFVITRGAVVPGSTEKMCQPGFEALFAELRKEFPRIIMDSPPVLGLSETTSLQRVVDGLLLVIMAESTARRDVLHAVDQMRKAGARFFGFVLNRLDLSRITNYYHYSYYSPYYYDAMDRREPQAESAV